MIKAALSYAAQMMPVFPLAPRGKLPAISKDHGGRGLYDATTDVLTIERWWRQFPDANIGVPTGERVGFFVVDIDPRHGGEDSLAALEREHGPLPDTVHALTGGGGWHILFKHVAGIRNNAGRLGAGIDVRGDGGYVAMPPSVHASGRIYAWSVDHHPDEMPIADPPAWLIERLRAAKDGERPPAALPETWRKLVAEGVGEGRRNDAVARLAGHLLRRNVDPYVVLDLVRTWNSARCRPPLPEAEVINAVNSIAKAEMRRRSAADGR